MAQCSNCVSNKRRSPSDLYAQHPSSKRAALELPSSSASSSGEQLLQNGYTIMPTKNLYDQFSDGALPNSLINNPFQEQNSGVDSLPIPAQPSQQPLYRTYSEPIPEAYQVVATAASPRPPAAGKFTSPPGLLKQESPGTKVGSWFLIICMIVKISVILNPRFPFFSSQLILFCS
ncbi:OLC1v1004370C2 [Oldenlandia corymbosa var. corymbosa]|uniref:OLC1v1004370C2 n=1 Tax=Oldenlandia corymbosa var. corymbosa TaxID=529605 RepID=A0AAV1DC45_OLDCO|nr:OLC1v1004370C2 [Oldenlandia corymbosa var. corymbosa]